MSLVFFLSRHFESAKLACVMDPQTRETATPILAFKEIEMILARQLADCLALPIFLVDVNGALLFYNEPAEKILGRRFEETGALSAKEWSTAFVPTDDRGRPLQPAELPLMIALAQRRPAHAAFWIRGWDHVNRRIQATAVPLIGRMDRFLGAVSIFWETQAR
jgi:PAS domain-containing protein